MEKSGSKTKYAQAGLSVRNGPVVEERMDLDELLTNGKRKSRGSAGKIKSYKEGSEGEELRKPNVR
jgi:DNA topoisomerase-1